MDKPVDLPSPPTAEQRPYSYERHGVTIEDPWHWLRDPKYPEVDDPDVLAYLKAENAYFDGWKAQHQGLIDQLFEEMKGRIKEDESSVPIRDGDWLYWWAFKPGAQYRTWYRKPVARRRRRSACSTSRSRPRAREYFRLGALEVSPDGKLLATLADYDGSERFELRIRDLATGKDIETVTKVGIGQPVWTSDSGGIVFTEVNDNWRSYRARYHRLGGAPDEDDHALRGDRGARLFSVGVGKSHDRSTIFVATGDNVMNEVGCGGWLIFVSTGDNATSEVRFVSADDPSQPLTLISRRKPNREYHVDAAHGKLWIHTNDDHVNFRLADADPAKPGGVGHGHSRIGPRLSDRRDRLSRPSRDQQPGRRARSADPAHLRRRGDAHPVRGSELQRLLPSAIPSSRRTPIASAIRRWSRRRRSTIITRRPARSRC